MPLISGQGGSSSGSAGTQIGYDAITGAVTVSSNSAVSPTTIITCAAHTFDGAAVFLDVLLASVATPASVNQVTISVFESTTSIARIGFLSAAGGATMTVPMRLGLRFTPTAGSHTYLITGFVATAGSATVSAAADAPSWARFTKA